MSDRIVQATCHTVEFAQIEAKLREWPEVEAVGSFREKKNNKGDTTKVFITFDNEQNAESCLNKLRAISGLRLSKTSSSNINIKSDNNDSNAEGNKIDEHSDETTKKSNDTIKARKGVDVSAELLQLKTRHDTSRNMQRNIKSKVIESEKYRRSNRNARERGDRQEQGKRNTEIKTDYFNHGSVTIVNNHNNNKNMPNQDERTNYKPRRRQNYMRDGTNTIAPSNRKGQQQGRTTFFANTTHVMNSGVPPVPTLTPPPQSLPFPPIPDANFASMPNQPMMPPPLPIPPSLPFDPFMAMPQPLPLPFPPMPEFQPPPLLAPPPSELPPPSQVPFTPAPAPFEASVAFVDNVPFGTTNEQLMKLFTPYGSVVDINRLETMAMICYSSPEAVQECIQHLNGSKIHDNIITVSSGTIRIPARVAAHIGIEEVCVESQYLPKE